MSEESLKEKTANGLMWSGISNIAQQILNLVFGIFLARLLSASDYGMVGMLTIFSLIATSLQEGGFMSGLNRLKTVTDADYNAVFWFNTLCSILVYAVLFLAAPAIASWFRQPVLVPLSRLMFLTFVISALNTSLRAWLFRNMKVREMAIITLVALVSSGVVGVTLAWNGFAYWGLVAQNLVYCSMLTAGSWWLSEWHPTFHIDFRPLRPMFGFSVKLLATNIFTHINNNVFSIFFGRLYGERTVGYYNQANKWTSMGYTMLSGMVWSVTQPLFARLSYQEPDRMQQVFRKMLRFTAFLSCPALLGLALIAPEFITITITAKWLPSAELMQLLCIGGAFLPISSLYSNFIISLGKSNIFMWNTIALCLAQMLLLVILYPFGIRPMVITYVSVNVLWLFVWHYFVHQYIGLRLRDALRDIIPFVLVSLTAIAAGWSISQLSGTHIVVSLILKILVTAVVYIGLLRILGAQILLEALQFLKSKIGRKSC